MTCFVRAKSFRQKKNKQALNCLNNFILQYYELFSVEATIILSELGMHFFCIAEITRWLPIRIYELTIKVNKVMCSCHFSMNVAYVSTTSSQN